MGETDYDVFISYSHADRDLAVCLEARLAKFRPPKGLDHSARPLRVFRDEGDLTGAEYYRSIDEHLGRSASLLVLCSPAARASEYVGDEIARFADKRSADRLIPVLVAGAPNNEARSEEEKAFPEALCERLEMPLAASYLGFDPRRDRVDRGSFQNAWYTILANVLQAPRSVVEERDRRRRRQRRNLAIAVTGAVVAALSGLTIYSLVQRDLAERRYQQALARQLAIQSRTELATPDRGDVALALAAEAVRRVPSSETKRALRAALDRVPKLHWRAPAPSPTGVDLHFAGDGTRLLNADAVWDVETGERIADLEHEGRSTVVALGGDGRLLARSGGAGKIGVWSTTGEEHTPEPLRHRGRVETLAFDPAGRWLVSGGEDSPELLVWDVESGELHRSLAIGKPSLSGGVRAAAFSPDGRELLVARRHDVHRLSVGSWESVAPPLSHAGSGSVRDVAFAADGSLLATLSVRSVHLWSRAGEPMAEAGLERAEQADRLALSADGSHVAVSGRATRVWRTRGLAPVLQLETGGEVAFSPDGERVAIGGRDQAARVIELASGRERARMPHRGAVTAVRFSPDGSRLATLSEEGEVRLWGVDAQSALARLGESWQPTSPGAGARLGGPREQDWLATLAEAEGRRKARLPDPRHPWRVVRQGGVLELWSRNADRRVVELLHEPPVDWEAVRHREETLRGRSHREVLPWLERMKESGSVVIAAASADGRRVLTTRADEIARLFAVPSGRLLARIPYQRVVVARFSLDGRRLVTLSPGSFRSWDGATGEGADLAPPGSEPDPERVGLHVSRAGRQVLTASRRGATLWKGDGSGPAVELSDVEAVEIAPDGRHFLARGGSTLRLFDFEAGRERSALRCDCRFGQVLFDAGSERYAALGDDHVARVRSVAGTGALDLGPNPGRGSLVFGPQGRWLVATGAFPEHAEYESDPGRPRVFGANEGWARAWRVSDGALGFDRRLVTPASVVVFSPDGELVALGPLILETATGRVLDRVPGSVVAFGPDGRHVASRADDRLWIWAWRRADLLEEACDRLGQRGLSAVEWARSVGDEPYQARCTGDGP